MRVHPFHDREGRQITMDRWADLRDDLSYCTVRRTELVPAVVVITRWYGIDDEWEARTREAAPAAAVELPKIFYAKTHAGYRTSETRRFATEADALAAHACEVDRLLGLLADRPTWKSADPRFNLAVCCCGCMRKLRAGDCRTTVVGGEAHPQVLFACCPQCEASVGAPELVPP